MFNLISHFFLLSLSLLIFLFGEFSFFLFYWFRYFLIKNIKLKREREKKIHFFIKKRMLKQTEIDKQQQEKEKKTNCFLLQPYE